MTYREILDDPKLYAAYKRGLKSSWMTPNINPTKELREAFKWGQDDRLDSYAKAGYSLTFILKIFHISLMED